MATNTVQSSSNQTYKFGSVADPVDAKRAGLNSIEPLSKKFGNINYDQDAIQGIFNTATDAEYATKRKEYERSANQYYNRLATSQGTYLDAMRKAAAQNAVQTGANAGMQNAMTLSSLLGQQQQTASDALELAQQQRALEDQYAEAIANNTERAMQYADTNKQAIANIALQEQANNAQQYAAELSHNAQLSAAAANAAATGYAADQALAGTQYNADKNLEGTVYTADKNYAGVQYNADKNYEGTVYSADQNLEGTKYSADKNLEGTKYASDNNLKAAQTQAAATRAAAASAAAATRYAADKAAHSQAYNDLTAAGLNTTDAVAQVYGLAPGTHYKDKNTGNEIQYTAPSAYVAAYGKGLSNGG